MKLKYMALGLLMALGVSVSSCSDDDTPEKPNYNPTPSNTTDTSGEKDEDSKEDDGKVDEEKMSVFICFGQSNMEGNAAVEEQDKKDIPTNFKNMIVANCDVAHYNAKRYIWRDANPPLARCNTGLTPADYFGRTLAKQFPNRKICIVMVAIGGAAIEGFDKEAYKEYYDNIKPDDAWLKGYFDEYDGNPYQTLITAAKAAQNDGGIIRGILLHQGESNNCQQDWPEKVKKIYGDMMTDLELDPAKCPLLVGETLRKDQGGYCWGHNDVIAKVPSVIPNSYVISSEGCAGKEDGLHFLASGYRTIGERYASQMLSLMQ